MSAKFKSGGTKERSSVRTLQEALSELVTRFPEIRDALASAEKALERRADLERQLAQATASESRARDVVQARERELEATRGQLRAGELHATELQRRLEALVHRLVEARKEIKPRSQRRVAEAQRAVAETERAVAEAEAGREEETVRRRRLEAELERLSEAEIAKRETLERREQELRTAREEAERSFRDALEAQGLLAVSHGEEQRSRAEAHQRAEALEQAEAEFDDQRRRIVELEGELREERGRRAEERGERDRIRAEATRRESELHDAERKLAQARRQHALTTDQLARTQRRLADQFPGAGDSHVATERELSSDEPLEPPPGPRRRSGVKGLARRTVVPSRWTIAG